MDIALTHLPGRALRLAIAALVLVAPAALAPVARAMTARAARPRWAWSATSHSAVGASSGAPAWKTIPSWYLIGTVDNVIPPAEQRFMAARAHAHTVEIRASHLSMVSHPGVVTRLIRAAAGS